MFPGLMQLNCVHNHWRQVAARCGRGILAMLLSGGVAAAAATALTTQARLVLSHEAARAGDTVWLGVHLRLAPNWHIYWENSGDAGIPTKVEWTLPSGWQTGGIFWPIPDRFESEGLVTYGYQNEVVLVVPLSLPPNAA